ncbi:lysozyme g-like [Mixophyes fleayi]|uniref:lysozyme g-like n=1 Tax=Mixophyes fleayi TaxID=3061075 RepID=UPI003F4DF0CE
MTQEHILDLHRSFLIQNITMVNPVLDELIEIRLLTREQYNCVWYKPISQEQMRELYNQINGWIHSAKDKVYESLKKANPIVIENLEKNIANLERRPQPAYKYGDVLKVDCTGASRTTTTQNNLIEEGVRASETMAQTDSVIMLQYKDIIKKVAKRRNIDPALIAGIISRSSRGGDLLNDGWGFDNDSFGLMQICKRFYTLVGEWNSEEHLHQAAGILVDMIDTIKRKFPEWTMAQQLKGGIAAYNCGPLRVDSYNEIDKFTVSQDYSNDVIARAHWFKINWYQ